MGGNDDCNVPTKTTEKFCWFASAQDAITFMNQKQPALIYGLITPNKVLHFDVKQEWQDVAQPSKSTLVRTYVSTK